MSDEGLIQIGEFEVDPSTIPPPPSLPQGQEILFEVAEAKREEKTKTLDDGSERRSVWVSARASAVDIEGHPSVFLTLWLNERFLGPVHRSFAHFLQFMGLPYTTRAADLQGVRFYAFAAPDKKREDGQPAITKITKRA